MLEGPTRRRIILTERPRALITRALLQEKATRRLKYYIALERCDTFKLWTQFIEGSRIIWGALSGILGVIHQQFLDCSGWSAREPVRLKIFLELGVCAGD